MESRRCRAAVRCPTETDRTTPHLEHAVTWRAAGPGQHWDPSPRRSSVLAAEPVVSLSPEELVTETTALVDGNGLWRPPSTPRSRRCRFERHKCSVSIGGLQHRRCDALACGDAWLRLRRDVDPGSAEGPRSQTQLQEQTKCMEDLEKVIELFENFDATTIMDFYQRSQLLSSCLVVIVIFPFYISYWSFAFT